MAGAPSLPPRYAPFGARVTWGTRTAQGETCFSGLISEREARQLAREWDKEFPDRAPYAVTCNGRLVP